MSNQRVTIALVTCTLLVAGCGGSQTAGRGSVEGRVLDRQGRPVVGARIDAKSLDRPTNPIPELAVLSGRDGRYEWSLPSGGYELTAIAEGFSAVSRRVTVSRGGTTRLDFTLERTG